MLLASEIGGWGKCVLLLRFFSACHGSRAPNNEGLFLLLLSTSTVAQQAPQPATAYDGNKGSVAVRLVLGEDSLVSGIRDLWVAVSRDVVGRVFERIAEILN